MILYLTGKNILNSKKTEIEEETRKKGLDNINKREKLIQVHLNILVKLMKKNDLYINFLVVQQK